VTPAFLSALAKTLGWEGGFSNSAIDRGGPTQWGITQGLYDRWRKSTGQGTRPVWQITEREMQLVYFDFFWDPLHCEQLPRAARAAVFDMAVHSGEGDAVKALQRAAGFKGQDVDGVLGPQDARGGEARAGARVPEGARRAHPGRDRRRSAAGRQPRGLDQPPARPGVGRRHRVSERQAGFLSPLRTEDLDGRRGRLLEPLRYYSAVLGREIVLEAGFVADSYSAPYDLVGSWIVRGIDRRPSWIHDKLYGEHSTTREQADAVLLEAMESVGIAWWRRQLIYRGVRSAAASSGRPDDDDAPQPQDPAGG
jgi:hypothetical protein